MDNLIQLIEFLAENPTALAEFKNDPTATMATYNVSPALQEQLQDKKGPIEQDCFSILAADDDSTTIFALNTASPPFTGDFSCVFNEQILSTVQLFTYDCECGDECKEAQLLLGFLDTITQTEKAGRIRSLYVEIGAQVTSGEVAAPTCGLVICKPGLLNNACGEETYTLVTHPGIEIAPHNISLHGLKPPTVNSDGKTPVYIGSSQVLYAFKENPTNPGKGHYYFCYTVKINLEIQS